MFPGGPGPGGGAADPGQDVGVEGVVSGGSGLLGVVVGVGEGVGHRLCPDLAFGVGAVERGQISEQVSTAPGVVGVDQVEVAGVAVADDGAGVAGQHRPGVDVVLGAPAGVHRNPVDAAWT